jgi:hypothetical protein
MFTSCAALAACSVTTAIPSVESTAIALGTLPLGKVNVGRELAGFEFAKSGCTPRFVVAVDGVARVLITETGNSPAVPRSDVFKLIWSCLEAGTGEIRRLPLKKAWTIGAPGAPKNPPSRLSALGSVFGLVIGKLGTAEINAGRTATICRLSLCVFPCWSWTEMVCVPATERFVAFNRSLATEALIIFSWPEVRPSGGPLSNLTSIVDRRFVTFRKTSCCKPPSGAVVGVIPVNEMTFFVGSTSVMVAEAKRVVSVLETATTVTEADVGKEVGAV